MSPTQTFLALFAMGLLGLALGFWLRGRKQWLAGFGEGFDSGQRELFARKVQPLRLALGIQANENGRLRRELKACRGANEGVRVA